MSNPYLEGYKKGQETGVGILDFMEKAHPDDDLMRHGYYQALSDLAVIRMVQMSKMHGRAIGDIVAHHTETARYISENTDGGNWDGLFYKNTQDDFPRTIKM